MVAGKDGSPDLSDLDGWEGAFRLKGLLVFVRVTGKRTRVCFIPVGAAGEREGMRTDGRKVFIERPDPIGE